MGKKLKLNREQRKEILRGIMHPYRVGREYPRLIRMYVDEYDSVNEGIETLHREILRRYPRFSVHPNTLRKLYDGDRSTSTLPLAAAVVSTILDY